MTKDNIAIEGARLAFRNFSGKEGRFNPAGRRNFCVLLEPELAERLIADGWNVRHLSPRDPGDAPQPYMQVAVRYSPIPPKIVLITSRGKTILDEESVGMLDWAEIKNVDLIIRPRNWNVGGDSGVKAYVKNMYVTIAEDEFAYKYSDCPDSALDSVDQVFAP